LEYLCIIEDPNLSAEDKEFIGDIIKRYEESISSPIQDKKAQILDMLSITRESLPSRHPSVPEDNLNVSQEIAEAQKQWELLSKEIAH